MKRFRLISIVVAVILLGGLAFAMFRSREPRYQGRTLSEWIKEAEKGPYNSPEWQVARHAVKQMAPDAIPLLLKWVRRKDLPIERKIANWLYKHPALHFQIPSIDAQGKAFDGFVLLGNEGKPGWPVLVRYTYDTDTERRYWAFNCLVYSRPNKETLEPVLLRLIHDPDKTIQYFAAWAFHDGYSQDAEAAGVYKMFPQLKKDFPTINTVLTNQTSAK